MKKYLALFLAVLMLAAVFAGCAGKGTSTGTSAKEGKVFNIYAWNEEFKGFFEKYYTVPEGVTVNWIRRSWTRPCRRSPPLPMTTRLTCSWLRPTTSRSTPSLPLHRTSPPWA